MDEVAIQDLKEWERKKLKRKIISIIKDKETIKRIEEQEILIHAYKNKLEENKKNRIQCIEENQKRKIKTKEFEKRMPEYEFEGYVFELEIAFLEKEITNTKALHKRLNTLYLLLSFYDGIKAVVMKDLNGEKKKLYQKDVESLFVGILLEEIKENLEMKQKYEQLYMLLNLIHNYTINKEHKFYLDEEDGV